MSDLARLTEPEELLHFIGEQEAEIARLQAELARVRGLPRLSQLDDENKKLRAAFLRHIASENECYAWTRDTPIPCDESKCGCLVELNNALGRGND